MKFEDYHRTHMPRSYTRKKLIKYYRRLRELYPNIPARVKFTFKNRMPGRLADCMVDDGVADIRFNVKYLTIHKLIVREFLHEMMHIISWPKVEHGVKFEKKVFKLRQQLFYNDTVIY